ncbi:MAG TPA: hypothetical protein VKU44_10755 [Terriglobia bacterium]|nr:hypothetical protein [Terriglobia bacterium]
MKRVFKYTVETSGREKACSDLLLQRELAEGIYRQGRVSKHDYEDLMRAFDMIEQELDLLSPELVA